MTSKAYLWLSDYRNTRTIGTFQSGNVPKHYEAQGRCYAEGLGADFVVFVLGWGLRPNSNCMTTVRIERDEAVAEALLDNCEAFIESYVKRRKMPPLSRIMRKQPSTSRSIDSPTLLTANRRQYLTFWRSQTS